MNSKCKFKDIISINLPKVAVLVVPYLYLGIVFVNRLNKFSRSVFSKWEGIVATKYNTILEKKEEQYYL